MAEAAEEQTSAPLDEELAHIARLAAAMPPMFAQPAETRRQMEAAAAALERSAPPIAVRRVDDALAIDGGDTVPVRIYRSDAPSGVVALFYHGGGFIVGSVTQSDRIARKLCQDTGATIVSIDYRLAPEHPFPAAHRDALTAALWAVRHLEDLDGDRLALIGESAGANLAASTAIACRDRDVALAAQVLIVPGLDFGRDMRAMGVLDRTFPMLNHTDLADIMRLYLGEDRLLSAGSPPSPLRAASLAGVAPALIAVAGHCPMRSEGIAYAARLVEEGVTVEMLHFPDMFHPFLGFFDRSAGARRAVERLGAAIRDRFTTAF